MTAPKVVAAIDFGTYGTGYAWTEVEGEEGSLRAHRSEPIYRDRWPGLDSLYPKDLSAVLLNQGGQVIAWGHQAKREWARLSQDGGGAGYTYAAGFKMALKADAYHGLGAPGTGSARIDSVAQAYPLVVSYLRRVSEMARQEITESSYLDSQIRWCLTVPAIWDEPEKQLMRKAAAEAGLPADRDRLLLALEPEAAAVYCQHHLARLVGSDTSERDHAELGTRFLVADCGGGTVDITAFQLAPDSYGALRLLESGKVSGGKLGSEYINEEFSRHVLAARLGGPEVLERLRRESPYGLLELMDRWESAKVTAQVTLTPNGPVIERPIYLSVPGEIHDLLPDSAVSALAAQPGGSRHRMVVTPQEAAQVFDRVIDSIIEEILTQLTDMNAQARPQDPPATILLVGGLSGSEYLRARLRYILDAQPAKLALTRILVPANPAAAVLFGAVRYACDPPVRSRLAPYTYGCKFFPPFEPGIDEPGRRFTEDGVTRCRNRFKIFVAKGTKLEAGHQVTEGMTPVYADRQQMELIFYRSPEREPRYIDGPGAQVIGTLTIALGAALQLPLAEREVQVQLSFGDTDISAAAVNLRTGERLETVLRFTRPD